MLFRRSPVLHPPLPQILSGARLRLVDVGFAYTIAQRAQHHILKNINLVLQPGEVTAILGASGVGKSTLLRLVAGFEQPTTGDIWLGQQLLASPTMQVAPHQRAVGYVVQDLALFPHLTVAENVAFGLQHLPKNLRHERIATWLQRTALSQLGQRYPHQLSGGQQQRLALARSLAREPRVLLLDEPFSSLDPALRHDLHTQLLAWVDAQQCSVLLVTHDEAEAQKLAGPRCYRLQDGLLHSN